MSNATASYDLVSDLAEPRAPVAMDPTLQAGGATTTLRLLDGFAVCVGGQRLILPAQMQRLLAYLAVVRCTSRPAVAGALWPETLDHQSRAALRTSLWRLHKLVPDLLVTSSHSVQFSTSATVDVSEFLDAAHRVLAFPTPAVDDVLAVPVGWRELLPGWDEDWVKFERERLRQLRLHVLELQLDELLARGDYLGAMAAGNAAIETDPLRESTNRAMIRLYLTIGDRDGARQQLESYRLHREMNLRTQDSRLSAAG